VCVCIYLSRSLIIFFPFSFLPKGSRLPAWDRAVAVGLSLSLSLCVCLPIKIYNHHKLFFFLQVRDFRRGIVQLQWDAQRVEMETEDLVEKTRDFQLLRVTKDLQVCVYVYIYICIHICMYV